MRLAASSRRHRARCASRCHGLSVLLRAGRIDERPPLIQRAVRQRLPSHASRTPTWMSHPPLTASADGAWTGRVLERLAGGASLTLQRAGDQRALIRARWYVRRGDVEQAGSALDDVSFRALAPITGTCGANASSHVAYSSSMVKANATLREGHGLRGGRPCRSPRSSRLAAPGSHPCQRIDGSSRGSQRLGAFDRQSPRRGTCRSWPSLLVGPTRRARCRRGDCHRKSCRGYHQSRWQRALCDST